MIRGFRAFDGGSHDPISSRVASRRSGTAGSSALPWQTQDMSCHVLRGHQLGSRSASRSGGNERGCCDVSTAQLAVSSSKTLSNQPGMARPFVLGWQFVIGDRAHQKQTRPQARTHKFQISVHSPLRKYGNITPRALMSCNSRRKQRGAELAVRTDAMIARWLTSGPGGEI